MDINLSLPKLTQEADWPCIHNTFISHYNIGLLSKWPPCFKCDKQVSSSGPDYSFFHYYLHSHSRRTLLDLCWQQKHGLVQTITQHTKTESLFCWVLVISISSFNHTTCWCQRKHIQMFKVNYTFLAVGVAVPYAICLQVWLQGLFFWSIERRIDQDGNQE